VSARDKVAGHVFISYVREDSDRVDKLQRTLQAAGIPVWRDSADLWPGEDWRIMIRRAITDNALVFMACFSRASLARGKSYQNEELTLAIEQLRLRSPHDPWLIPVRFDRCEIPDRDIGGGRTLTSIQRADLFGRGAEESAARLTASVLRILGVGALSQTGKHTPDKAVPSIAPRHPARRRPNPPGGAPWWTAFDLNSYFPKGWQEEIIAVATESDFRAFPRTPILSREGAEVARIERGRVHADTVRQRLPWLCQLYRSAFVELASEVCGEPAEAALDDRYGVVLDVQRGTGMRFECHVDSNPLTGVVFCTEHPAGGGELVFGHDPTASSVEEVERDCSAIRPQAGQLIFFDGRTFPHYSRVLLSEHDMRIVAVMNFYTQSWPEQSRLRTDLNRHLYGDE
jgi:TIR domain